MAQAFEIEFCCILHICCGGPEQIKAKAALAKKLQEHVTGINAKEAARVAEWILDTFDLAPAGTLRDFKTAIAAMAREYPYTPDTP